LNVHGVRNIPWITFALGAVAVVTFVVPGAAQVAEFERSAVAGGQWWRYVTAHWAHFSGGHLAWSLLAFVVLGVLCERWSRTRFLVCTAASAVVVTLAVWAFERSLQAYRGLSGIDSGLFVLLAASMLRENLRVRSGGSQLWCVTALAALAAFAGKVGFEWITGGAVFVDETVGGFVPVPLAHAAGAIVGAVTGAVGVATGTVRDHPRGGAVATGVAL
jgi:rhomboid family GlyGly-CTERM serine protease